MWYSLAQFTTPGRTRNNFTSMVDVSNIEDYTRAILAGRRRGTETHDHGVYIAPRETRHIVAEVVLTHDDQLTRRHWPDVVNVHYSNHDVKGISTSPWVRMGLIPPNLEIEVPYRVLIPRGLRGLLVTGKAISATHDALPAIRMQADMENLGGVAALAAAQAVRSEVDPADIDVTSLQQRLIREGVLTEGIVRGDLSPSDQHDLQALVDGLTGEMPLYSYSDMEMGERFEGRIPMVEVCTAGTAIVPYLERALATADGLRRIHLAQALAVYRSPAAVPVLVQEIERLLTGGNLPPRDNKIRHAGYPPDQGAMPDVVYLLYSLAMTRDAEIIRLWQWIADLLRPTDEDIRDRRRGTFYYVEAICWGAEDMADPAAVPVLRQLHSYPPLRNRMALAGFQPDFFQERQAILEVDIGRALARCGDRLGLEILIAYLDDVRALLAEGAHANLVAVTGENFGKDRQAWRTWMERDVVPQARLSTASTSHRDNNS